MPEPNQITFTYKEVAEALLKRQDIHQGIWGLYVRFGIKAANMGEDDESLKPAAIIPILDIGLQKFDKENNLSVDAAKVNPTSTPAKRRPK
jgi:hypothetical protein